MVLSTLDLTQLTGANMQLLKRIGRVFSKTSAIEQYEQEPELVDGWCKIYSGGELLRRPDIAPTVERVRQHFRGGPDEEYARLMMTLTRYAAFVQLLPASEDLHHYEPGGLLLHGLDCAAMAGERGQQIQSLMSSDRVKRGVTPEEQWLVPLCFQLQALTHDIGKVAPMFKIHLCIIDRANRPTVELYDPLAGGFGKVTLYDRLVRARSAGARAVRYRFEFSRERGRHAHEAYWFTGAEQMMKQWPDELPGDLSSEYFSESTLFTEHLRGKLTAIDQESLVGFQRTRGKNREKQPATLLRALSEIACSCHAKSLPIVPGSDGELRMFVARHIVADGLPAILDRYGFESLPYQPDQFLKRLRGEGLVDHDVSTKRNVDYLTEHGGFAGVFLRATVTKHLMGEMSYRTTQQLEANQCDDQAQQNHNAVAGSNTQTTDGQQVVSQADEPKDVTRAVRQGSLFQTDADAARDAATRALKAPAALDTGGRPPNSFVSQLILHFETLPADIISKPEFVKEIDRRLQFLPDYLLPLFSDLCGHESVSADDRKRFAAYSKDHCSDLWTFKDWTLTLSESLSDTVRNNAGIGDPTKQVATVKALAEAVSDAESGGKIAESSAAPGASSEPAVAGTSQSSRNGHPKKGGRSLSELPRTQPVTKRARDFTSDVAGLLDAVVAEYAESGERLLWVDGDIARLDFRALDRFSGGKQHRGKLLDALRNVRLYIDHERQKSIRIKRNHPGVKRCLAELQKNG